MKVTKTKCDKCTEEAILRDIPDYKWEPWGKMPIWGKYRESQEERLCVEDAEFDEAVCLEHLGLVLKEDAPQSPAPGWRPIL